MKKLSFLWLLIAGGALFAQGAGHSFNGVYKGDNLHRIAYPIGGMGAGMFCLERTGAISAFSVYNNPDVWNEPTLFTGFGNVIYKKEKVSPDVV